MSIIPTYPPPKGYNYYALLMADDTPIDGSATTVTLDTFEGPITVSIGDFIAALNAYTDPAVYPGFDHILGQGLYTIPGPTDAWVPVPIDVGDTVMFLGVGMPAWGHNSAGPASLPLPGSPADHTNGINMALERSYVDPAYPTNNYTPADAPHDFAKVSGEAHRRGIDNALGGVKAAVDALSTAYAAATDDAGRNAAFATFATAVDAALTYTP